MTHQPCPAYSLGDLIDQVGGFALAFTGAAKKSREYSEQAPSGDVSRLGEDWRVRIPRDLAALALALAWREPDAWTGMTRIAGMDVAFGPSRQVPDDVPLLDRVVALAGRDPHWSPGPV